MSLVVRVLTLWLYNGLYEKAADLGKRFEKLASETKRDVRRAIVKETFQSIRKYEIALEELKDLVFAATPYDEESLLLIKELESILADYKQRYNIKSLIQRYGGRARPNIDAFVDKEGNLEKLSYKKLPSGTIVGRYDTKEPALILKQLLSDLGIQTIMPKVVIGERKEYLLTVWIGHFSED